MLTSRRSNPRRKRQVNSGESDTVAVKRVTITDTADTSPEDPPGPLNLQPTQVHQATARVEGARNEPEAGAGESYFLLTGEPVRWFSTNPAIFTVDFGTGVVTAVAVGEADLVADADGYRDRRRVIVTNPQNAVASIEIVEGTGSVNASVGQTFTRQARVKDAGGNLLAGKTVTWPELTGTTLITVGADSGDENHRVSVTADAVGTATFKASCEGVDSATLTVNISAAGTDFENEPAGYIQCANYGFDTITGSGWTDPNGRIGNLSLNFVSLDTDATAPKSPGTVLKWTYNPGAQVSPVPYKQIYFSGGAKKRIYICAWWKLSNPWEFHASGANKMFFVDSNQSSTENEIVFLIWGSSASVARIVLAVQDPEVGVTREPNLTETRWTLGAYHKFEAVLIQNTGGLANGEAHWWVDGVKNGQYTNVKYKSTGDALFNKIKWQHYWGGQNDTKTITDFIHDDHIYVSGVS
jgi:hypothetical protein